MVKYNIFNPHEKKNLSKNVFVLMWNMKRPKYVTPL